MSIILDVKYIKADLNKVMNKQRQHLTAKECHRFLHLLNKFEDLFDGTLGMWKTIPVDLELKNDAKPVFSGLIQYQKYTKRCSKRKSKYLRAW